jgi:hypothetical protein
MQESDIILLEQAIDSLNYSSDVLENSINKKNPETIDRAKKAILETQKKISYLTRDL